MPLPLLEAGGCRCKAHGHWISHVPCRGAAGTSTFVQARQVFPVSGPVGALERWQLSVHHVKSYCRNMHDMMARRLQMLHSLLVVQPVHGSA